MYDTWSRDGAVSKVAGSGYVIAKSNTTPPSRPLQFRRPLTTQASILIWTRHWSLAVVRSLSLASTLTIALNSLCRGTKTSWFQSARLPIGGLGEGQCRHDTRGGRRLPLGRHNGDLEQKAWEFPT